MVWTPTSAYLKLKREQENQKRWARRETTKAIREGFIVRKPCVICDKFDKVQVHHHDYSQPLDVEWFCPKHHYQYHSIISRDPAYANAIRQLRLKKGNS